MVTLGAPDNVTLPDGWTVVTMDGGLAAHWEHTVAVTSTGPWVLTARDGGRAELAALGVEVSALAGVNVLKWLVRTARRLRTPGQSVQQFSPQLRHHRRGGGVPCITRAP